MCVKNLEFKTTVTNVYSISQRVTIRLIVRMSFHTFSKSVHSGNVDEVIKCVSRGAIASFIQRR